MWTIIFAILFVAFLGMTIWLGVTGSLVAVVTGVGAFVSGAMSFFNYKAQTNK
jgi:hypothetical protein